MDEPQSPDGEQAGPSPVFISYASVDRKRALGVCRAIERRGRPCWIACRDVRPGENYQEAIVRAIRAAPALVLIFSAAANGSDEIKKELSLASRHKVPLLALRIEDVEPSDAFAYELSTRQWIDAFPSLDKAVARLVARIDESARSASLSGRDAALHLPRRAALPAFSARALAAAVALLALVAVLGAYWLVRQRHGPEQLSLAVLPFADLSPARDKAYFAEGVAEEIQSTLAAERGIKVLGRTSSRQIGSTTNPAEIRRSLGVTHLLEGSARSAGDALRVNVRLIDTADGASVWEEEYEGRLADVFSVQDRIAQSVAERLRGTFLKGAVRSADATGIDAYETYLAARSLMRERKEETLTKALELAKNVVSADPKYAPGHAIYAELLFLLSDDASSYGRLPVEKVRPVAVKHAREAILLAPDQAEGYAALGLIMRGEEGIRALQRAIKLDPARAELRIWLGVALNSLGRHDEAFRQFSAAAETEPLWAVAINRYVQALSASGRLNEARQAAGRFRQRGGSEAQYQRFLATIALAQGDLSSAIAANRAALASDPHVPNVTEYLARQYAALGLNGQALDLFPAENMYDRLWVSGQRARLRQTVIADGAKAWDRQATDTGMFALAALRDWPSLLRLYRDRPAAYSDLCANFGYIAAPVILALRNAGARAEGDQCFRAARRRTDFELGLKSTAPAAVAGSLQFRQASLLALAGDRRGLDWLSQAVDRGWVGQYFSSSLADWPQFDVFRGDPRYAAAQRKIDARVAREREEVLRHPG